MPVAIMAQQDPQFSQYMNNPQMWNPAYSALKPLYMLNFHHRTQWLGYSSTSSPNIAPPSTQLLTFSAPIQKLNSGLGLGITNDQIGPLKNLSFYLSYAYYLQVGEGKIAGGIGFGAQSITINTDLWRPEDGSDPTLLGKGSIGQWSPNFRIGLAYFLNDLYIGVASTNVASPTYTFGSNFSSKLERHYYIQAAYRIALSERLGIQPSFLFKKVSASNSLELSNLFFMGNVWAGLSYRTSDALVLIAGIDLLPDKSLKVGYNFDLTVINKSAKAISSHEIFLSYNISSFLDNRKPIVRTPRFRF